MFDSITVGGVVKFGLALLVWYAVIDEVRKRDGAFLRLWRGMTFINVVQGLGILIFVIASTVALFAIAPFTRWSWVGAITNLNGNLMFAPISDHTTFFGTIASLAFILVLLYALPSLAHFEEEWFRNPCYSWRDILKQAVVFGPLHCLMGAPLGAGLTLILSGIAFGWVWKRAANRVFQNTLDIADVRAKATDVSARVHTVYNTAAVLLLALAFFL